MFMLVSYSFGNFPDVGTPNPKRIVVCFYGVDLEYQATVGPTRKLISNNSFKWFRTQNVKNILYTRFVLCMSKYPSAFLSRVS